MEIILKYNVIKQSLQLKCGGGGWGHGGSGKRSDRRDRIAQESAANPAVDRTRRRRSKLQAQPCKCSHAASAGRKAVVGSEALAGRALAYSSPVPSTFWLAIRGSFVLCVRFAAHEQHKPHWPEWWSIAERTPPDLTTRFSHNLAM